MNINVRITLALCLSAMTSSLYAADNHIKEHGGEIFHKFRLEAGYGATDGKATKDMDMDGWVGTDENRLWVKSEAQRTEGQTEKMQLWILYSRNVSTFWDFQAGMRADLQPDALTYFVLGVDGLAPYFSETEAHLFISREGDVSARLKQRNDFLVTQRLILQPYFEASVYAQAVKHRNIGAGLSQAELGMQARYEFTRKFAPYLDIKYERKFGETASIVRDANEDVDAFVGTVGLRLMF